MSIITVSRTYGSGGSDVAAGIAATLGWNLLDNSVVDEVAARTGLSTDEVASRDERRPSFAERLASAMTLSTQEMITPMAAAQLPPSEQHLLAVTKKVIEEAATRGSVVIVGRGAQMTLGSRSDVFAVMCCSPPEALVRRCMRRDSLDHDQAVKRVSDINRERQAWVKTHWGRDWRAMENYHLCVNTDLLGIDGSVRSIVDAARTFFAGA